MGTMLRVSPVSSPLEIVFWTENGGELQSSGGGRGVTIRAAWRRQTCGGPLGSHRYCSVLAPITLGPRGRVSWDRSGNTTAIDIERKPLVALGLNGMVRSWNFQKARPWECVRKLERISVRAAGDENDNKSGDDQVETLFMKELRRRGMHTEEQDSSSPVGSTGKDTKIKEEENEERGLFGRSWPLPGASKTRHPPPLTQSQRDEQLKRSMALNSEGLDGLIPRGTELLKLGGSFFLVFWPFILGILAFFSVIYLYFGPAFIHSGNLFERGGPPSYKDPYQILEEEVLPPQVGPDRVPYNLRIKGNSS